MAEAPIIMRFWGWLVSLHQKDLLCEKSPKKKGSDSKSQPQSRFFLQQETILELVGISKHSTIGSRACFKPPTRSGGKLRSLGLALISGDLPFSQNPMEGCQKDSKKMGQKAAKIYHIHGWITIFPLSFS